jgi:hypothetical protein
MERFLAGRFPTKGIRGLRQSNNLIAKLEKFKLYGISRDISRDFDLVSLTWLTLTAKFSLAIDKIYFFNV